MISEQTTALRGVQIALLLPHQSDSLDYHPCKAIIGEIPILQWWLEFFNRAYPAVKISVVSTSTHLSEWICEKQLLAMHPTASLKRLSPMSELNLVMKLLDFSSDETIALCRLSWIYTPPTILIDLVGWHIRHKNGFTTTNSLPWRCAPEIYEAKALRSLCNMKGLPENVELPELFRRLKVAGRAAGIEEVSSLAGDFEFTNALIGNLRPGDLPERAEVVTQTHVEELNHIFTSFDFETTLDPWEALKRLRVVRSKRHSTTLSRSKHVAFLEEKPEQKKILQSSKHVPIRILFVSNASAHSGAEESLMQLVRSLNKDHFELFAVIGAEGHFSRQLKLNCIEVFCPGSGFGQTGIIQSTYLINVIAQLRPSLVHLNGPCDLATISMLLHLRIPFVSHVRVLDFTHYQEQLRASSAIIAISSLVRDNILRYEIDKDRVFVIPNEVDTSHFTPELFNTFRCREMHGFGADEFVVLKIARFTPYKRHDLLLSAAKSTKRLIPNLRLILLGEVYGDATTFERCKGLVNRESWDSWIEFLPYTNDVRTLMAASNALVLCSDREPFGRCVSEAMSMALPVIVSNCGGANDVVIDNVNGLVFRAGRADELSACIIKLAQNRELGLRLASAGRKTARSCLEAKITSEQITAVYSTALKHMSDG